MVLAGLSLSLMHESLARKGFSYPKIYSVLARRALIIAGLGMLIGSVNERIVVILVHYGLLFLLLPLALRLPRITIWVVSASWLIVMPILWRPLAATRLGAISGHNPTYFDLLLQRHCSKICWLPDTTHWMMVRLRVARDLSSTAAICIAKKTAASLSIIGTLVAVGTYVVGRVVSLGHVEYFPGRRHTLRPCLRSSRQAGYRD